jgi:hypothetical protein
MRNAFERKVIRKVYGPELVNGQWRNRYNNEIYNLCKELELTRNIRLRRLQWLGHVLSMKDERAPKKALKGYREGRRPVGRPRGRWTEAVDKDVESFLKCKNWRWSAQDREAWRRRTEEAKAQVGLQRHRRRSASAHRIRLHDVPVYPFHVFIVIRPVQLRPRVVCSTGIPRPVNPDRHNAQVRFAAALHAKHPVYCPFPVYLCFDYYCCKSALQTSKPQFGSAVQGRKRCCLLRLTLKLSLPCFHIFVTCIACVLLTGVVEP